VPVTCFEASSLHDIVKADYTCSKSAVCDQLIQQDLHLEIALPMNSDAMMEHALNRDIAVMVNIIVLTAPTRSTAVRKLRLHTRNNCFRV